MLKSEIRHDCVVYSGNFPVFELPDCIFINCSIAGHSSLEEIEKDPLLENETTYASKPNQETTEENRP